VMTTMRLSSCNCVAGMGKGNDIIDETTLRDDSRALRRSTLSAST
jgi:hypothetical protein